MGRILVIDDDPEVLAFRRILLGSAGHDVRVAENGNTVVEEIEAFHPDLVITDIMMPGVTGGGVYEIVRRKFGPDLPVIVSSASRIRLSRATDDMLAYFPKSQDEEALLDLVQKLLDAQKPSRKTP